MANKDLRVSEIPDGLAVACEGLNTGELRKGAEFVESLLVGAKEIETCSGDGLAPPHDEIAKLAFAFYELRGREDGHDIEDWCLAEEELLRRRV